MTACLDISTPPPSPAPHNGFSGIKEEEEEEEEEIKVLTTFHRLHVRHTNTFRFFLKLLILGQQQGESERANERETDKQTDRQTDRQTETETERGLSALA